MTETPNRMERPEIWGKLADAPDIQEKVRVFIEMIPEDVETIVDVGCGDGAISNVLGQRWRVVGVDSSRTALQHVTVPVVLADARELPFDDGSFDLVMSSQLLEHLDEKAYSAAVAELRRVARKYVLISVPYDEDLDGRLIQCPACGLRQHVWGHVRRFTSGSLLSDLIGFEPLETRIFGDVQDPAWPAPLLWFTHNIANAWYSPEGQNPQCSRCGNTDFTTMRRVPRYVGLVKRAIDHVRRNSRAPYWLAVLGQRESIQPGC